MKAMILVNLSSEAEIANGTRGTIRDIMLDAREEALNINEDNSVRLQYPPALILFEPGGLMCQLHSLTRGSYAPSMFLMDKSQ
jgi:hypothetical protein